MFVGVREVEISVYKRGRKGAEMATPDYCQPHIHYQPPSDCRSLSNKVACFNNTTTTTTMEDEVAAVLLLLSITIMSIY